MNKFSHCIVPMQFQIVCPRLTYLTTIVNWLLLHLSGPPLTYMEQSTFSSISLLKKWITGWPWTYSWSWPYVLYWLNPNPDHMLTQISALDWPYKSGYDTQPCDSRQRVTLHHLMCILACDPAQVIFFRLPKLKLESAEWEACFPSKPSPVDRGTVALFPRALRVDSGSACSRGWVLGP